MDIDRLARELTAMTKLDGERLREQLDASDLSMIEEYLGINLNAYDDEEPDQTVTIERLEAELETHRQQVAALSGASKAVGVVGATITLRSGTVFDYINPTGDMCDIEDIAWALAKEGRYANHLPGDVAFSVGQHSCIIYDNAAAEDKPAALMHDSPEFVCKDIPKPLKMLLGPGYAATEKRVWLAIAGRYDLPIELPKSIKVLDWRMLNTERLYFAHDKREDWNGLKEFAPFEVSDDDMTPWSVDRTVEEFLNRFNEWANECR